MVPPHQGWVLLSGGSGPPYWEVTLLRKAGRATQRRYTSTMAVTRLTQGSVSPSAHRGHLCETSTRPRCTAGAPWMEPSASLKGQYRALNKLGDT